MLVYGAGQPEPPFFAWSRSRPNLVLGPRTSGAAKKSGGSGAPQHCSIKLKTLCHTHKKNVFTYNLRTGI